jgi:hypothetical protein
VVNANFITGMTAPYGMAISGNILDVLDSHNNRVGEYNATTGAAINASFISLDVDEGLGLALSGNTLYVVHDFYTVGAYNATTGATINDILISTGGSAFVDGLAASGNNLYVTQTSSGGASTVGEYDATTGAPIVGYTSPSGLDGALGIVAGTPTPEPGSATLVILGGLGLLAHRRRSSAR